MYIYIYTYEYDCVHIYMYNIYAYSYSYTYIHMYVSYYINACALRLKRNCVFSEVEISRACGRFLILEN